MIVDDSHSTMSNKKDLPFSPDHVEKIQGLSKNLVAYIQSRHQNLSHKAANYTVQYLLSYYPAEKVSKLDTSKREKEEFLKTCYNFLFGNSSISGTTVHMLSLFYKRYLDIDSFQAYQKQVVDKKCTYLQQKLTKTWHNPTECFKEMHNDFVKLILIKEGMDYEEDKAAFEEIKIVMNNLFPLPSFSMFVTSSHRDKVAFVNAISAIAAGMRVYNASYQNPNNRFMVEVANIMKDTLPKLLDDFHEELVAIKTRIENLQGEFLSKAPDELAVSDRLVHYKKLLLIFLTNYKQFITTLQKDVNEVATETYRLDYTFALLLKEIKEILRCSAVSQADKVHPSYKNLSKTWKQLQLQGQMLSFFASLFFELKAFVELVDSVKPSDEIIVVSEEEPPVDEKTHFVGPDDVNNLQEITLECLDFCSYFCSFGVLVPCNREIGLAQYKGKYYGFASTETLENFCKNPEKVAIAFRDWLQRTPELMITLRKEKTFGFPDIRNKEESVPVYPVFIRECSAQTVTHPVQSEINHTYNWNQWDLRRQALTYVSLLDKKTHSTQTPLSHFRRENHSQVYLPKNNSTQTKKDAATLLSSKELPELILSTKKS